MGGQLIAILNHQIGEIEDIARRSAM